jgi:hypothetical protein
VVPAGDRQGQDHHHLRYQAARIFGLTLIERECCHGHVWIAEVVTPTHNAFTGHTALPNRVEPPTREPKGPKRLPSPVQQTASVNVVPTVWARRWVVQGALARKAEALDKTFNEPLVVGLAAFVASPCL